MTGAALSFEPQSHTYRLPDGRVVPSVTTILRAVGVSADFEALRDLSSRTAQAIDEKRDLGVAVHADCWAYDDHDLDWASVDPRVHPYVVAWEIFRANLGIVPIQRERRLYSPTLDVCGTLDVVGARRGHGDDRILIDIKTGDPEDAGARYQTAGYALLWNEEHPTQPITARWSVRLMPDKSVPYRIHDYSDGWQDAACFRAFVTTFRCQHARRSR